MSSQQWSCTHSDYSIWKERHVRSTWIHGATTSVDKTRLNSSLLKHLCFEGVQQSRREKPGPEVRSKLTINQKEIWPYFCPILLNATSDLLPSQSAAFQAAAQEVQSASVDPSYRRIIGVERYDQTFLSFESVYWKLTSARKARNNTKFKMERLGHRVHSC